MSNSRTLTFMIKGPFETNYDGSGSFGLFPLDFGVNVTFLLFLLSLTNSL